MAEPVELIDVYPTLLSIAGISAPADSIDGRDLLPLVTRRPGVADSAGPRLRFTDTEMSAKRKGGRRGDRVRLGAVVRNDMKLIETQGAVQGREMYDLAADPRETCDLATAEPAKTEFLSAKLAARLMAVERSVGRRFSGARRDTAAMTPELEEDLRALGYVE